MLESRARTLILCFQYTCKSDAEATGMDYEAAFLGSWGVELKMLVILFIYDSLQNLQLTH